MTLASMILLLVAAVAMHKGDTHRRGWGFQHVYRHGHNASHERREQHFVPAVLTVESIRAAMTAVILAALLDESNRTSFLPGTLVRGGVLSILGQPRTAFFLLVISVLAFSLVTTMAALLCYEYATRFTWRDDWPKVDLLQKAFHFGVWGFYCLMWSLAVVPVLVDYRLGFLSILVVFVIMWLYYFFPERREDLPPFHSTIHGGITEAETLRPDSSDELARIKNAHGDRQWHKRRGVAALRLETRAVCKVELHWYEANGIGKRELKLRRYMDQPEKAATADARWNAVACEENSNYPAALELNKLYTVLSDPVAEADGFMRVIDESGQDYLYPARYFVKASLERAAQGEA